MTLFVWPTLSDAQVTSSLAGIVTDETGGVVGNATISIRHTSTNVERQAVTNAVGRYQLPALGVGSYRIIVQAPGFRTAVIEDLRLEVGRTAIQDFVLSLGDVAEELTITASGTIAGRATFSAGHLVDRQTIEAAPLNGRHFLDLGVLAAGSVTPPQTASLARPNRLSAAAINTAGHREGTTNFLLNGINMNDQWNNVLMLQPMLGVIEEFRIDTSTPSAEYGRNSGAVVNIATRSGTNVVHASLFDFFRDDDLDAANYFGSPAVDAAPFQRHQFGGDVGGPIVKSRTFFRVAFEGVRQQQGLDVNTVVPSDSQRGSVTDPTIARLLDLIPRATAVDVAGTARFVGFASAPLVVNQTAIDMTHALRAGGNLHGFYAIQLDHRIEPFQMGNTIPGFGHSPDDHRQVLTLSHSQPLGSRSVNEARFGFNRNEFDIRPVAPLSPAAFGIATGPDRPALPQINVSGAFNFGGPATLPLHNRDVTVVASDSFSSLRGNHALKIGGEFRRFVNNNEQTDAGTFNFPSVAAFLAGAGNSFSILSGDRSNRVAQGALGLFVQDAYNWRPHLTIDAGVRYEWNVTPVERNNRFVVLDPSRVSLLRVGVDTDARVYRQNNRNVEPRVGLAWTAARGTVLRGGYAMTVQQPTTDFVLNLTSNPPFGIPLSVAGPVRLENAIQSAQQAGLAPLTVQPDFRNATVHSWNATVQRDLPWHASATVSYVASRGTHLPIALNINQPVDGVRPFQRLSNGSPILPGVPLGNIVEAASIGRSTYQGLWVTLARRLANGFSVDGSYTLSAANDTNSLTTSSGRVTIQDSNNPSDSFGPSDFDARHRFVVTATYAFPWHGSAWTEGWQLAAIVQGQSGNPVSIVTSNSTVNGTANTLRPDQTGPITIVGRPDQWFDTSSFAAAGHFGNLPRNTVVGPRFDNVDLSLSKGIRFGRASAVLRADVFNLFNHPNFGQPGGVVGSPNFGAITNTRFPVGDVGSSRQVQLAATTTF
jgi:Carboxypeptidase regulatory-like domain/TonB dependent receptor-like, beta-barrel